MSSRLPVALIAAWCVSLSQTAAAQQRPPSQEGQTRIVREGLTIDFALKPYEREAKGRRAAGDGAHEGDTVAIGFEIRDAGSGNPVSGLNPAAWLATMPAGTARSASTCTDRVKTALSPSLLSRPEVDLNTFYVLALNADATITVVDPVFGYGGTKLLAMIPLESPGADWALTSDHNRLFVSMPAANRVAVVDTRSWSVVASIDTGRSPSRIRLQPDEAYLWVDYVADQKSARSGVTVVNTRTLKAAATIPTGNGPHDMAFSDDNRFAFVLNGDQGTVSVIDVRGLRNTTDIPVGTHASSIASSTLAEALYVTNQDTGEITVISATTHTAIARIAAEPGIEQVRFAPGGRLGFVVNRQTNAVAVIDASVNRLVHTAGVEKAPDQLAFSTRYAYVRHHDSEIVRMIPLNELGPDQAALPQLDFPGGQHVLGTVSRSILAPAIVQAADDNAVLVVNPGDKAIYYYQEGMAAPMGHFSNYGKEPLAVMVVDRSLRETTPGSYVSTIRLPEAGRYSALLFVNSPRVIHCFDLSIAPGSEAGSSSNAPPVRIESLTQQTRVAAGSSIRLTMRLTDGGTGKALEKRDDALALIVAPGVWQIRVPVEHVAKGVYALTVSPPAAGLYDVYVTSASLQLPYTRVLAFEATEER